MSDAARAQLEKEIERQTVEGQRFEQDAQAELNELQQELQHDFQEAAADSRSACRRKRVCRCCSARAMPA